MAAHRVDLPPHPSNVPGDFYVEEGCCTYCGIPSTYAPDLFAVTKDHCWVKRQPVTPNEFGRMLVVFKKQEFGCIRYRGTDPAAREADRDAQQSAQDIWGGLPEDGQ